MFDGVLGYGTKKGFIPFRYDQFLDWAKKQGSRYARLYKPWTKRFTTRPARKRSICAKLHLKSNCRCYLAVTNSLFPEREIRSPSPLEVDLWLASEIERKEARHKFGLRTCPRCPAKRTKYPCPFAKPVVFDLKADQEADPFLDRQPDYWKTWTDCKITECHFKPNPEELDDWLDMGHSAEEFYSGLSTMNEF